MSIAITYNLQKLYDADITSLYSENTASDIWREQFDLNIINREYKNKKYKIIRYEKPCLTNSYKIRNLGLFRSVILNNENKIVSFAPPKSLKYDDFIKYYDARNCIAEEYIEGTMINMFYNEGDWEISTKNTIGGEVIFFLDENNHKTFRQMFLDVCDHIGLDFDILNINYCYSFVLQHPNNRIVSNISEKKLFLVKLYKIENFNIYEVDKFDYLKTIANKCIISIPEIHWFNSFSELQNKYDTECNYSSVGVMLYSLNGERTKIRNPTYEKIRILRGNQPKLQYHYLVLRKEEKVKEYLSYFPEHTNIFKSYNNIIYKYISECYQYYILSHITKEQHTNTIPYKYKKIIYELHRIYLFVLRPNKMKLQKNHIKQYISKQHPSYQMYILNYDNRNIKYKIDANSPLEIDYININTEELPDMLNLKIDNNSNKMVEDLN